MRIALALWLLCQLPLEISQQPTPAPVKAGHQPERQALKAKNSATNNQDSTEKPPSPRPALVTEPQTREQSEQRGTTEAEWWLVYVTGALVLITAFLAAYTARLWEATKTLSQDAKATADRQAGEVRESLQIGRETVEAMERHSERRLRAYVTVSAGRIRAEKRGEGTSLTWYPHVTNTGQTPARNVLVWVGVAVLPLPLPTNMDFTAFGPDSPSSNPLDRVSRTTIGAGQVIESNYSLDRLLTDSEMRDLRQSEPRKAFYICGTVTYEDIFRTAYRTDFCIYAVWPASGLCDPEGRYTEQHNEAN